MKLSEELFNAFSSRDLVEIDFCEKAISLENEIDFLKSEIEALKKYIENNLIYNWSNQR